MKNKLWTQQRSERDFPVNCKGRSLGGSHDYKERASLWVGEVLVNTQTMMQVVIPCYQCKHKDFFQTSFKHKDGTFKKTGPSIFSFKSWCLIGPRAVSALTYSWGVGLGLSELQSKSRDQPIPLTIFLPTFWVYSNVLPNFLMFPGLIHRFVYGFSRNNNINSKGSWDQPLTQKLCLVYLLLEPSSNLGNVPLFLAQLHSFLVLS